jgi:glycosyltransferase involved in cell wall biosynthesis
VPASNDLLKAAWNATWDKRAAQSPRPPATTNGRGPLSSCARFLRPVNLILADPTLKTYMGHSFEYARSLGEHAETLGQGVTTLASRHLSPDVGREIEAVPCFRFDLFHHFKLPAVCSLLPAGVRNWLSDEWNYSRHARWIRQDLEAVGRQLPMGPRSLVLFPTVGFNDIEPVVRWAERLPKERCPWIALVFHFTAYPDYSQPYHRAHYYTRALKYLERSCRRSRFRLFTDSDELADEYSDYTRLPLRVLPIPHVEPVDNAPEPQSERRPDYPVRLTYLGDARMNKGFHLLPQLFQQLEPEIRRGLVEGEIQANVRFADEWRARHAANRLARQKGIVLHDRELSSREYYALLDRADIVLLPYLLENYHSQTSGIFAEALALGKPVVVPRGTWMSRQLRQFGAWLTFLPGDRRSLYETCQSAIEDCRQLKAQAIERRDAWKRRHSPGTYLQLVMDSFEEDGEG